MKCLPIEKKNKGKLFPFNQIQWEIENGKNNENIIVAKKAREMEIKARFLFVM